MNQPISPEQAMARAVELARQGFPAPNPRVGCVLVTEGAIVGEGYHDHAGGPHAEAAALQAAGERSRGAHAFVTLEPCNHHGRTPPCSQALISAGVAAVTYAVADPNPTASGGADTLRRAGILVNSGLLAEEAAEVNSLWLQSVARKRPRLVLKAAMTLDGKIARSNGESKWITGEAAREDVHRLRAELGGVMVGRGTVECDDPLLTARIPGVVNQPVRIVLDTHGKLNRVWKVFNFDAPTVHLTKSQSLERHLEDLYSDHGVIGVLLEGGAESHRRALESGLVDEIILYVAPAVFGDGLSWNGGQAHDLNEFDLVDTQVFGPDVRLRYRKRLP